MRLRLAGVNPNSDAIRIMISACRLAIETPGRLNRIARRQFHIVPYFWSVSMASAQSLWALQ